MRSLFYVVTALAVIGLAFWAYRENYETQEAQAEAQKLQRQIALERQRLRVLKAEWAYLNRPDRLRELAELNFERLGLMPLQPYQFGKIDQVGYPPEPEKTLDITDPVDVIGMEDRS
ncbi:cell division protein FtsL [Roseovarius sp. SYSU LYC5161]|jgi:hypothetical protein|uniref:cell division protein FtsL n=1 Tax=Roseovarius halophilus (ex Wu et al. 2025) TaxID=3376060 RepID=UPI002872936E|nr:cell division protein FtsL [Roseovarius sp.]